MSIYDTLTAAQARKRLERADRSILNLKDELAQLKAFHQSKVEALEDDSEAYDERIEGLEDDIDDLKRKLEEVAEERDEALDEHTRLEKVLDELRVHNDGVEETHDHLCDTINEYREDLKEANKEVQELRKSEAGLRRSLMDANEREGKLQAEVAEHERIETGLREQINDMFDDDRKLCQQVNDLKEKLEATKSALYKDRERIEFLEDKLERLQNDYAFADEARGRYLKERRDVNDKLREERKCFESTLRENIFMRRALKDSLARLYHTRTVMEDALDEAPQVKEVEQAIAKRVEDIDAGDII